MKKKYLISVPYIYPVCPLSIDHAKIMLVADINARVARSEEKDVYFPIACHYSGVTAEKVIENLNSNNIDVRNKERDKFIKTYKTPRKEVENFESPNDILDYYTVQTILDLKRLNISCDYENFYRTNEKDYENFVHIIFENYDKHNLLIKNTKNELALNYDDPIWKQNTKETLEKLNILHPSLKNNITSSLDNVKGDWGILRDYGIGVPFKDNYVIDPMFDSELFVIYDLYKKFQNLECNVDSKKTFDEIFNLLKNNRKIKSDNPLVNKVLKWLPTDLFVCEEHLKNWVVKKTFSENILFNKKYYTMNYFITGMGYIEGKRMSSSRGTAILLKDLLDVYGSTITRMIIMFTGGHPSKMYNYTEQNITTIKKMLNDYYDYIVFINSKLINEKITENNYIEEFENLYQLLKDGFYQQLLVELMKNIMKKYIDSSIEELIRVKNTQKFFMNILLPDIKI